ncbi:MCE family protein [Nocardia higoensis]|uniref:MCE family protein n=1 Tax=Nocardia higoensis TaxID=228599 RepID=A0ABS0DB60_9NOCA|nr:MCE family protein [Nocardia higoensis]
MTIPRLLKLSVLLVTTGFAAGCLAGSVPGFSGSGSITITAEFDDAAGLFVGNSVAILGMPVGTVEVIEPNGESVHVTLTVDKSIAVPADAMAVTVSTSVLTDRHVEFTPPYRGEGPILRDGDHLGLDRTRTPVDVDSLLATADRLALELAGDGTGAGPVADLLDVASAITAGQGQNVRTALSELSRALRLSQDGGAETEEQITTIVTSLETLTAAAAANDATIREFGGKLGQLTDMLADEELGTGHTGAQLNALLLQATSLIEQNRENIRDVVTNTTTITDAVVDFRRNVAEVFDVLPLTLDNVYNAVDPNNRALRVHALVDRMIVDGQLAKEVCNLLGLRNLGCATGTLQDYGPDFGVVSMLEAMTGLPK